MKLVPTSVNWRNKFLKSLKPFIFQLVFALVFKYLSYVKVSETPFAQNYATTSLTLWTHKC